MQRAIFPMNVVNITQKYGIGTHVASFAIDNAGKDGGIDPVFAPFDCIVKKTYTPDANEVWIESCEKVQYADGTEDYMCIMFAHDNNISDLYVGKKIKQGEVFYQEGTKGMSTGNHIHMECGKGKFSGSGWFKNSAGYWGILNAKKPQECLFIESTTTVKNNGGYSWKKTTTRTKPEEKKATTTISVGDTVKVKTGATDYKGGSLAAWVYTSDFEVLEVSGDRIVIGIDGVTTAAMKSKDLTVTKKKATSEAEYKVGDLVKICGKYASSASGKAEYSGAIGQRRYITKIHKGCKNPYQLGTVKGSTAGYLTTGFAPEKSISK